MILLTDWVLLQPGVASVYCSIVQQTHNGVELYVREFPEMAGMQFWDIRRRFDAAIIVGFMAKSGDLRINPAEEEVMPEGARLVALADDGAANLRNQHAVITSATHTHSTCSTAASHAVPLASALQIFMVISTIGDVFDSFLPKLAHS